MFFALCHTTVNASKCYQTVDRRSEANRLKALDNTMPTAPLVPEKSVDGKKVPEPVVSFTQAGIQDLGQKGEGLQDLLRRDQKPPDLSKNQLAIRALQAKVSSQNANGILFSQVF